MPGVDVVVGGGKLVGRVKSHPLQDGLRHRLPVQCREALYQAHVVDVVLQVFALDIGEALRYVGSLRVFLAQRAQGVVELGGPSLRLVALDQRLPRLRRHAVQGLPAQPLVIARSLYPQIAAAGMDHQVQRSVLVPIHLYEVIPSTQRTQAQHGTAHVDRGAATQRGQIDLRVQRMGPVANALSGRHLFTDDAVQPVKVYPLFFQRDGLHAASDVHAYQVRNSPVLYGHGRADGTCLSRVYIRHDADSGIGEHRLVAHILDLQPRSLIHFITVTDRGVVPSTDFNHGYNLPSPSIMHPFRRLFPANMLRTASAARCAVVATPRSAPAL